MEYLFIGLATAINLVAIIWKLRTYQFVNAFIDASALYLLYAWMGGTLGGNQIASLAGAVISIYLYAFPPEITIPQHIKDKARFVAKIISILIVLAIVSYLVFLVYESKLFG